eukprot:15228432-Alexandrium_andersonii.AAC.1
MEPARTDMFLRVGGSWAGGRGRGDRERLRATRGRTTSTDSELTDTGDSGGERPAGVGGTEVPDS